MLMSASSLEKIKWKILKKGLPGGFYDTISGKVKTMADDRKGVKAGKNIVLNSEVTYACALALQHKFRFWKAISIRISTLPYISV